MIDVSRPPQRGLLAFWGRGRGNQRVRVKPRASLARAADAVAAVGCRLLAVGRVLGKVSIAAAFLAAVGFGTRWAAAHVMASPRFALQQIQVSPTSRVRREEVLALAGVVEGERLLALDTDVIAARVARHPWIASVRVHRQLPSALAIDVNERRAAAVASLGGLYLIDETGRAFKRATMDEAEGLPVLTGIERGQYVDLRSPCEAAFREALGVVAACRALPTLPVLSEVNIDPRFGFTLFFRDGGAEVRLGRGAIDKKLATLGEILEALPGRGVRDAGSVRVIHLDGANRRRVPVALGPQLFTDATKK